MDMLTQELQDLSLSLQPHFKPDFLQQERTVFQFCFNSDQPFYLIVATDRYVFQTGKADSTDITLYVDAHETAFQLLQGSKDGMQAFMDGSYRADGNIVLSQLLLYLFKPTDPTLIYEVQD